MLDPEEIISRLRPCRFRYNNKKQLGDKINYGLIAQDILNEFGSEYNFVQKDQDDNFYQVNYHQFIGPLISTLQKQQHEINELKKEIILLKNKDY